MTCFLSLNYATVSFLAYLTIITTKFGVDYCKTHWTVLFFFRWGWSFWLCRWACASRYNLWYIDLVIRNISAAKLFYRVKFLYFAACFVARYFAAQCFAARCFNGRWYDASLLESLPPELLCAIDTKNGWIKRYPWSILKLGRLFYLLDELSSKWTGPVYLASCKTYGPSVPFPRLLIW